jgi:hypothetical protein
MSAAPSLSKEIAQEFVRVSKLTESGKDDEAWRAANALYKKYPNEATPNFIISWIWESAFCAAICGLCGKV